MARPPRRPHTVRLLRLLVLVALVGVLTAPTTVVATTPASVHQPRAAAPGPQVTVRVLSYNIRFGSGGLDRVLGDIRRTRADVVLLNEVDTHRRGARVHQARYLARRLGMRSVYDANIAFRWGTRGNAVLSRFPVVGTSRHDLHVPSGTRPRGLMRVRLATRGVRFDVWVTHLTVGNGKHRQARDAAAIIGRPTCPTIVGGDTNSEPATPADRTMRTHLDDVWRAAGRGPGHTNLRATRRIDYLYESGTTPAAAWVTPLGASDHRGVVGVLGLPRERSC